MEQRPGEKQQKIVEQADRLFAGDFRACPCSFRISDYQEARMDAIKGQADLIYRKGIFYLAVTLEVPAPPAAPPQGTLGVDLGIVNLATDSEGESFSGAQVERVRARHHTLRQRLQRHGTKSANRNAAINISRAAVKQPIVGPEYCRNNRQCG